VIAAAQHPCGGFAARLKPAGYFRPNPSFFPDLCVFFPTLARRYTFASAFTHDTFEERQKLEILRQAQDDSFFRSANALFP
jgi:hypothetical protein